MTVAAVSVTVYRFVSKRQLNKINRDLSEIKRIQMDFAKKNNNKSVV